MSFIDPKEEKVDGGVEPRDVLFAEALGLSPVYRNEIAAEDHAEATSGADPWGVRPRLERLAEEAAKRSAYLGNMPKVVPDAGAREWLEERRLARADKLTERDGRVEGVDR